jgi:hypothetical protein
MLLEMTLLINTLLPATDCMQALHFALLVLLLMMMFMIM